MKTCGDHAAGCDLRACVIGDPVAHSRSPLIHGYWIEQLEVAGSYEKRRITADEIDEFLDEVRTGVIRGANVTVPHKERVAGRVDCLTDTASRLGAVNTVWRENGQVWGDNTDVTGFLANLDAESPGWDANPEKAVVLGAGGAARAIVFGLLSRGFRKIIIVNRSESRAHQLASELQPPGLTSLLALPWTSRDESLEGASLLVNTTALGMTGQPPLEISLARLPANAVVNDIVYVPLETELLRAAKARGNKAVDGLGMLLHQAAPGFERWFGQTPQVTDELRRLVIDDMNGSRA